MKRLLFLIALGFFGTTPQSNAQQTYDLVDDPFYWPLETLRTLDFRRLSPQTFDSQRERNWCWAATTATVIDILIGSDIDPCEVASDALGRPCCAASSFCDQQNTINAMEPILRRFGYRIDESFGPLSASEIVDDIRQGYPVTIRVEGPYGGGHFINIVGFDYLENNGQRRLELMIHDPMHGFYVGSSSSMGYSVSYSKLIRGRLIDYDADWTHSYRYMESN